jgi:hypothetical protein
MKCCDAVFAFFYRGIRKPDHCDFVRIPPPGMHFDLHLKGVNAEDGGGIEPLMA